ncbi:MAG: hypothetical protein BGO38_01260 [Cellulomonas sp. 73-145]|nr:MAG: hypothetical protein BGO38_01260 [Cellulomonas sp. 73-145]
MRSLLSRYAATRDRQSRLLRHQEATAQPRCFVFDVLIPNPAASVVESGRWGVAEQPVAQFVADVAVLPCRCMAVVVDDGTARTVEDGDGGEGFLLWAEKMRDLRCGATEV